MDPGARDGSCLSYALERGLLWPTFTEACYVFAVFGFVTASFASFFVGQEARSSESTIASAFDIAALRAEIRSLSMATTRVGHAGRTRVLGLPHALIGLA